MTENSTIRSLMENSFQEYAGLPSIATVGEDPLTYAELEQRIFDLTAELLSSGIGNEPDSKTIVGAFPKPESGDLAVIIYTSGTTGSSKGVMLTHGNIASNVVNAIKKFPIDSNDRFLSILPLAHTFEATGGMPCPLSVGVNIFYMQGLPTPQKLLAAMDSVKPTGVLTVPLIMDKIYRNRILPKIHANALLKVLYRLPLFRKLLHKKAGARMIESLGGHLRFFMFGGAALNQDVETYLRDANISHSTGYAMTETSPILTINPFGRVKIGSCGQPIPGIEMKIDNPDPETGIGEILVKGPNMMQGYYKNLDEASAGKLINEIIETTRLEMNTQLPAFSAISRIEAYPEPFEMTPTNKVKRCLYI